MDDIRQRDLSSIPDDDLTAAERGELKRRFEEFRTALAGSLAAPRPKRAGGKKAIKWDPALHGRKH